MKSPVFEVSLLGTHSIIIPNSIAEPFYKAGHKRVKVKATFKEQSITIYAALKRSKDKVFSIMFGKSNQKAIGIFPSDYFKLQFFEDNTKYGVEMPEELEAVLLTDFEAYTIFENLTDGKKRSIIYIILRIKSPQTRVDKALIIMENLKRGITDQRLILKPH